MDLKARAQRLKELVERMPEEEANATEIKTERQLCAATESISIMLQAVVERHENVRNQLIQPGGSQPWTKKN